MRIFEKQAVQIMVAERFAGNAHDSWFKVRARQVPDQQGYAASSVAVLDQPENLIVKPIISNEHRNSQFSDRICPVLSDIGEIQLSRVSR